jgi:hypothetical protein
MTEESKSLWKGSGMLMGSQCPYPVGITEGAKLALKLVPLLSELNKKHQYIKTQTVD